MMETELQDTLKLAFAQNEVECIVFEQTSCAKFEHFWSVWSERLGALSTQLKDAANDFQMAQTKKRIASRMDQKDMALDILISGGNDPKENLKKSKRIDSAFDDHADKRNRKGEEAAVGALPSLVKLVSVVDNTGNYTDALGVDDPVPKEPRGRAAAASSVLALKMLLDDLHPDVFNDFRRQVQRPPSLPVLPLPSPSPPLISSPGPSPSQLGKSLELLRKSQGEGKKRLVPSYAVARAVLLAADKFWENAMISELFLSRLTSGILISQHTQSAHTRIKRDLWDDSQAATAKSLTYHWRGTRGLCSACR